MRTVQRGAAVVFPMLGGLTVDPPAGFTLFGHTVYFYGVFLALSFLLGGLWCVRNCRRFGLDRGDLWNFLLWLIPVSVLGARLSYVLSRWEYYGQAPGEIFAVRDGGLSLLGGLLAGAVLAWLLARRKKLPLFALTDCAVHGLLIGQAVGCWGSFLNREAFGPETGVFWRMGLLAPDGSVVYVHPTFLYEGLWALAGLIGLLAFERRGKRRYDGQSTLLCLLWFSLGQVWTGFLRAYTLRVGGVPVSPVLSAVLLYPLSLCILLWARRRDFGPGALYVNQIPSPAGTETDPAPAETAEQPAGPQAAPQEPAAPEPSEAKAEGPDSGGDPETSTNKAEEIRR